MKRMIRVFISLLVVGIAVIFLLPFGAKVYLQKWLVDNGAESATIEKIWFNPFRGSLSLEGVSIQRENRSVFSNSSIYMNFGLSMLLRREAHLQEARLANVMLDIERAGDGSIRIGSYTLTGGAAEPEVQVAVEQPEAETITPWLLYAQQVELENVAVHYRQPDLEADWLIEKGSIVRFSTNPQEPTGSVSIKGLFNDAPFDVDLNQVGVAPHLLIQGRVKVTAVDLSRFAPLLEPSVSPFQGVVGLDGTLALTMDESEGLDVAYDGAIGYAGAKIGGPQWSIDGEANWIGKAGLQMSSSELEVATDGIMKLDAPRLGVGSEEANNTVQGNSLAYEGQVRYVQQLGAAYGATVETKGRLFGQALQLAMPGFAYDQESLDLDGQSSVALSDVVQVSYQGKIDLGVTSLEAEDVLTVDGHSLQWQGAGGYTLRPDGQEITADGRLTTEKIALRLDTDNVLVSQERSVLESDLALQLAEQPILKGKISAQVEQLQLLQNDEPLGALEQLTIGDAGSDGSGGLQVPRVEMHNLQVAAAGTGPVTVTIPLAAVTDISTADFTAFTVGEVTITEPEVAGKEPGERMASLNQLAAKTIEVAATGDVAAQELVLRNGDFLFRADPALPPLLTLGAMEARALQWSAAEGFRCESVNLDALYGVLVREKQAAEAPSTTDAPPPEKQDESGLASGLPVMIGEINLSGKTGFSFTDQTLSTPFQTELLLRSGRITGIDLNDPEKPFTYRFEGMFDTYSPLIIEGSSAPLAEQLLVEQQTILKNYSLQKLSPYVVDAIGTYFESGELALTSTKKIKGKDLDLDNQLVLQDIQARTVDDELAAQLNNQLPVPLDLALSMLRDNKGNIELDVPISGNVDDLSFGLNDIIVTALGKAITVAVAPYLAYTFLGPAGALVYMGGKVGQAMLETDLPSIRFAPDGNELSEEQKAILDKVGPAIGKDSTSTYSICAKVAVSELDGVQEQQASTYSLMNNAQARKQLFEIGEHRAMTVKEYLLTNHGIDEAQLLICNPGVNFEDPGTTVIEFKK